jgi:hypothetical protein
VSTAAGSAVFEVDDGSGNATKETASDTTGLRNRKQPATSETTTTTSSSTNKNDPLLLFAPLPSQHLRSSQDAFRNGGDVFGCVSCVNNMLFVHSNRFGCAHSKFEISD